MRELHGSEQTSHTDAPALSWHDFCSFLDSSSADQVLWNRAQSLPEWCWQPGQYFFERHPQKRAREVLCLKLSLLRDICAVVGDEHEHRSRARGVIGPDQILVRIPERRPAVLPIRWNAQAVLVETQQNEPAPVENMPEEMARSVNLRPVDHTTVYAAPCLQAWPPGKTLTATALVQSADLIPDDDQAHVRGLVRVHIIADGLQARNFSNVDVFRVTLPFGSDRETRVTLWARKVEAPERGIIVSGMTDPIPAAGWTGFTQVLGEVRPESEVAVYRAGSPADDLYSCGMLLLCALVGSDETRWRRVCANMPVIVAGLEPMVQGLTEDDHYTLFIRVRDRLREAGTEFEAGLLPNYIWWDAMVVVLRACSRIRGFSYATEERACEPSPVRSLIRDLSSLVRRMRVELFESEERDAAIVRACDSAMGHFGGAVC